MLLIGFGAGLLWGLMGGLSIGVVPTDRADMATGIFSTTRVTGEGIALATVGAGLAALIYHQLNLHGIGIGIGNGLGRSLIAPISGDGRPCPRIPPRRIKRVADGLVFGRLRNPSLRTGGPDICIGGHRFLLSTRDGRSRAEMMPRHFKRSTEVHSFPVRG